MIKYLVLASLFINLVTAQRNQWLTLTGQSPVVIARGGYSGLFPDSSKFAYEFLPPVTLHDTINYCDLQLTKEGIGFCLTELRLDNSTNIATVFPKGQRTYNVNGKDVHAWFAVDHNIQPILFNITLMQNILTRPSEFDAQRIELVEELIELTKPPHRFWLNVPYALFYDHLNVSPTVYLEEYLIFEGLSYVSSPEIGFLKSIAPKLVRARVKVIFRFLQLDAVEPSTKQTYGAILKDLAAIKQFASGILVPKTYIWPVTKDNYLLPPTTLVTDAHRQGLEVYASGFVNDSPGSFNYSYDPSAEYLQFVDNGQFSVDGVLTDFSATASEAIACLAHTKNASKPQNGQKALVISHNGASGDYPGSTDLAYEKAVTDGVDIIDCSVQMSKDGVALCMDTPDIAADSNAITVFMSKSSNLPEIQQKNGIFTFDLTWTEIQSLKPQLMSPLSQVAALPRNPAHKNQGKFLTLTEFLDFAKAKPVTGILINIQNAAFYASKKGLDIVGAVTSALSNATFDKQVRQRVMIQSDDTSVLSQFKGPPSYTRVYKINDAISDAPTKSIDEIKRYAEVVDIRRTSVFVSTGSFLKNFTQVVEQMHRGNLSVHVSTLYNEYTTLAFDMLADPMIELATLIKGQRVDGVVTEYPATAVAFLRSPCADPSNTKLEYTIHPAKAGGLIDLATKEALPPESAPAPGLDAASVVDPPLPAVTKGGSTGGAAANNKKSESHHSSTSSVCLSLVATLMVSMFLTGH